MSVTPKVVAELVTQSESFVQRLVALKPGMSDAKVTRFNGAKATIEKIGQEADRLASVMRPAAARAASQTGFTYKIERMVQVSTGKDGFAIVVITCNK